MPRVHTKKAKFDTYNRGMKIDDPKTKRGYRIDRSKPADENDTLFCKKGETYYQWSFRYGGTRKSKTYPKPSQLTQSDFLQRVYSIGEALEALTVDDFDTLEDTLQEIKDRLEELMDEQQEKKDNMPQGLQEGDVGMMLEERYEYCYEMYNDLDCVNIEVDDDLEGEELIQAKEEVIAELQGIQYQGS